MMAYENTFLDLRKSLSGMRRPDLSQTTVRRLDLSYLMWRFSDRLIVCALKWANVGTLLCGILRARVPTVRQKAFRSQRNSSLSKRQSILFSCWYADSLRPW